MGCAAMGLRLGAALWLADVAPAWPSSEGNASGLTAAPDVPGVLGGKMRFRRLICIAGPKRVVRPPSVAKAATDQAKNKARKALFFRPLAKL